MTLGIAWVRVVKGTRELLVASDSRLSGGQHWDANAKIMLLPRTDAVISFAGATADAYPLMRANLQFDFNVSASNQSVNGLSALRGHLVRVFNHSRKFIQGLPRGQIQPDNPEAVFLLSGYDWRLKACKISGHFTIDPQYSRLYISSCKWVDCSRCRCSQDGIRR